MNQSKALKKQDTTVLIVDDQPIILKTLAGILKDEYRILVATSGEKAIDICTEDMPPDLILLDINMPDMDGYKVCRTLKASNLTHHIPIIFVTAETEPEEEEKGFLLGASDYIVKPFKPAVVRVRIRNQIQAKRYMDMLEELAFEDPLTDIANRRSYEEMLSKTWKQAVRENKSLSYIMFDIDYFKEYNDHYGHGAGDECLRKVAHVLKECAKRPFDLAARYGGEEFVVILYDSDRNGAKLVAEKIIKKISELNIPHEHSPIAPYLTISAGYTSIQPTHAVEPEEAARRADQALYHAKERGRNQALSWRESIAESI
jgi:diguanylate cyclase (GGDEF)-like protein